MRARTLLVAISPCPNDTFCFQPWVEGAIESPYTLTLSFHDIENLNVLAKTKALYDVTKLSTACLNEVEEEYVPLTSGAAFAMDGGPKIVAKKDFSFQDLPHCTMAVPGRHTSAFVAMALLYGCPKSVIEMPSSEIMKSIIEGKVDAGLVIHEARFVFSDYGLHEIVDIGDAYAARFQEPLPLGVIAARRSFGTTMIDELSSILRASVRKAKERAQLLPFVTDRAQELCKEIIWQHIHHFVTEETESTDAKALRWIEAFLERAKTVQ